MAACWKTRVGFLFLAIFLFIPNSLLGREKVLKLADWAVEESSADHFLQCSEIESIPTVLPSGQILEERSIENLDSIHFFSFFYEQSNKKDKKHIIVESEKALAIRAFIHVRDYEKESLDHDSSFPESKGTKEFDTVHVLAINSEKLSKNENDFLFNVTKSLTKGSPLDLYGDNSNSEKIRDEVLEVFKKNVDERFHKMVKGPIDSMKDLQIPNRPGKEAEWGERDLVGPEAVCYEGIPIGFFDLSSMSSDRGDRSENIYVLFYGGDDTGDFYSPKNIWRRLAYNIAVNDYDDFMGVIAISKKYLDTLQTGDRFVFFQRDPKGRHIQPFDFAVVFEIADTSAKQ